MQQLQHFGFADLQLWRRVTGPIEENTYLVINPASRALLIDPGDDAAELEALIKAERAKVEVILLTHAHFDHLGALEAMRRATGAEVHLHPGAREQFSLAAAAAQRWGIEIEQPAPPDVDLLPGPLEIAGMSLDVRYTPGHAPGHVALYFPAGFVLAGDALFKGSIGRTDLPGSDHSLLLERIRTELFSLPPETVVFPGHGFETTIDLERRTNPFLQPVG